jgi:hypothetical protein
VNTADASIRGFGGYSFLFRLALVLAIKQWMVGKWPQPLGRVADGLFDYALDSCPALLCVSLPDSTLLEFRLGHIQRQLK